MVTGERLVPVPSLPLADAERLFIERARAEAPHLVIDAVQSAAITELCERLDRLPLAIELAASRVRALSPVELAAALDERFRLLVGGRRNRVERHQTMRGTLDWSYELCSEIERAVFDRLSVFPAGFDLVAARVVAGGAPVSDLDVVDVVPQLVDRSLVQRTTGPDGTSRYHLLETMRAYGREHLQHEGTADEVRERHSRHIASTINALSLATIGPSEAVARQRIAQLLPDCLVACTWFIDHHDWDAAFDVACFGVTDCEREQKELYILIAEAVAAVGDEPEFLGELTLGVEMERLSVSEVNRRAWEMIDAGWQIPAHRFSDAPQTRVEGHASAGKAPRRAPRQPAISARRPDRHTMRRRARRHAKPRRGTTRPGCRTSPCVRVPDEELRKPFGPGDDRRGPRTPRVQRSGVGPGGGLLRGGARRQSGRTERLVRNHGVLVSARGHGVVRRRRRDQRTPSSATRGDGYARPTCRS